MSGPLSHYRAENAIQSLVWCVHQSIKVPLKLSWLKPVQGRTYKDTTTQKLIKPLVSLTWIHTEQGLLLYESNTGFSFNLWIGSFFDSVCGCQLIRVMLAE